MPAADMPSLRQLPIHGARLGFARVFPHVGDLDLQGPVAEGDLQHVALLHLIARLDGAAVGGDARAVAGLVGDRAALDQPGNLQKFIKPHRLSLKQISC